ncbi:DUF2834 domain-containing protein [Thalassotalea ganghwensis]
MRNLFLIMAVVGAIIPYVFFFNFIQQHGVDLTLFTSSLFVNGAAGGFSADLLISSFVFWLFMYAERDDEISPSPLWFVLVNLTIGLSCALPAYLYVRESNKVKREGLAYQSGTA